MKKQIRCGILMQTDGTGSRVNHMISSLLNFGKYISGEELMERINAVSLDDVKRILFQIFFEDSSRKSFSVITSEIHQQTQKGMVMDFSEFNELWV